MLIDYRREYGDTLVPPRNVTPDGFRPGEWLAHRRRVISIDRLLTDRIAALDGAEMIWDVHTHR